MSHLAYENTGVERPATYVEDYLGWSIFQFEANATNEGVYIEAAWDCGRGMLADDIYEARKLIRKWWMI
jgi:hypothetical protein